jgi:HPt (histidine-containing phosphotransfer) domain-containing protein
MLRKLSLWPSTLSGMLNAAAVSSHPGSPDRLRCGLSYDAVLASIREMRLRLGGIEEGLVDDSCLARFVSERSFDRSQRILSTFVTDLDGKILRLKDCIANRSVSDLRAIAHSARGGSMMVGAVRLAKEGQRLDVAILKEEPTDWCAALSFLSTMTATHDSYLHFVSMRLGAPPSNAKAPRQKT